MIPSYKWFPPSLQERAAWMQNFVTNLTPIAATVGVTALELTALGADNADFQSLAQTTVAVDSFKSAAREYRISQTEGHIGEQQPSS